MPGAPSWFPVYRLELASQAFAAYARYRRLQYICPIDPVVQSVKPELRFLLGLSAEFLSQFRKFIRRCVSAPPFFRSGFRSTGWSLLRKDGFRSTGWSLLRKHGFRSTGWSLLRKHGFRSTGWSLLRKHGFRSTGWSLLRKHVRFRQAALLSSDSTLLL